jgi:hypothetical protein
VHRLQELELEWQAKGEVGTVRGTLAFNLFFSLFLFWHSTEQGNPPKIIPGALLQREM